MASSILLPACAITLALLFLSPVATFAATIYDIHGNPLENAGAYHIVSKGPDGTGGLTLKPANDSSPCPLSIKQHLHTLGSPVTIASPYFIRFLSTALPVVLHFNHFETDCSLPLRWWVTKEDENSHRYVIVGVDEDKFKDTYYFNIEEANERKFVYNIKFCHISLSKTFGTLSDIHVECNDVGLIDGVLGITPEPFPFAFKKIVAREFAA